MSSYRLVWGGFVVASLLGCPPRELRDCNAARDLSPSEHWRACAQLFKDATCRNAATLSDGGPAHLSDFVEACRPAYCPHMSGSIRVCAGALGTPAEGYGVEVEFIQAALVVDYDRRAPEAVAALGDAADRLTKESEAFHLQRRAAFDARVRLDVHLSGDARQVEFTTLRPTSDQSMTIDPGGFDRLRCREFITRALDGGSLPPGSAARVTASKRVQYRVIRCILDSVEDAGVARDDISFSIDRAP